MKTVSCLILCLFCFFCSGSVAIHPAMAQDASANPLINLTAKNRPLGDVLETITRDTGYRFNLNHKWKDYPVSATIGNLSLEQGLKRILRSLNHTIIWESDKIVTIMVFGKAGPGRPGSAISFASPPQPYPEETEPSIESEPASADELDLGDTGDEAADTDAVAQDEEKREPGNDESDPNKSKSEEPSGEPTEQTQPAADEQPVGAQAEN